MTVYELDHDLTFKHLIYTAEDTERYEDLTAFRGRWFYGESHAEGWIPPKAMFNPIHKRRKKSDCPPFLLRAETLSGRAVEVLGDVLRASGELLPLRCDEGEYFVHNVTSSPGDVLDMEKSDFHKSVNDDYILHIREYAFHAEKLDDLWIFKLPQNRNTRVYVTDRFRSAVEDAGLIGFVFIPLWPAEADHAAQKVSKPPVASVKVQEKEISDEDMGVIAGTQTEANEYLKLTGQETPKEVVVRISAAVEALRVDPLEHDEETRHATMLGAFFGEQVVRAYGWSWAEIGTLEGMNMAVVSPDRSLYLEPLQFVWSYLADKDRDMTLLLTFNMLSRAHPSAAQGSYTPIM